MIETKQLQRENVLAHPLGRGILWYKFCCANVNWKFVIKEHNYLIIKFDSYLVRRCSSASKFDFNAPNKLMTKLVVVTFDLYPYYGRVAIISFNSRITEDRIEKHTLLKR